MPIQVSIYAYRLVYSPNETLSEKGYDRDQGNKDGCHWGRIKILVTDDHAVVRGHYGPRGRND